MGVLLECSGLTKRFGKREALKQVDLSVESGKIVGLLGPNGSGKTTLIKLANGLLRPDGGSIRIDGEEPGVYTKSIVSYLPDRCTLPTGCVSPIWSACSGIFTGISAWKRRRIWRSVWRSPARSG